MKEYCALCGIVESINGKCPVCRNNNLSTGGQIEAQITELEEAPLKKGQRDEYNHKQDMDELDFYRTAKNEGRLIIQKRLYAGSTNFRVNARVKVISSVDTQMVGMIGRIMHPCQEYVDSGDKYVAALREGNGKIHNLKASDYLISYRACRCGSEQFTAHQLCRHDVIVDGDGNFESDAGIYDSERPYGPFECVKCGAEYDSLEEMDDLPNQDQSQHGKEGQAD